MERLIQADSRRETAVRCGDQHACSVRRSPAPQPRYGGKQAATQRMPMRVDRASVTGRNRRFLPGSLDTGEAIEFGYLMAVRHHKGRRGDRR